MSTTSTPPQKHRAPTTTAHLLPPSPPASLEEPSPPATSSPPPSSTLALISTLQKLHSGAAPAQLPHTTFSISRAAFARLYDDLFAAPSSDGHAAGDSALDDFRGWCRYRLRWDWDPEAEELTVRMPNAAHEEFVKLVREEALSRRDTLAKRWREQGWEDAAKVLDMIDNAGHTTIVFDHREQIKYRVDEDTSTTESDGVAAAAESPRSGGGSAASSFQSSTSRETQGPAARRDADIGLSHQLQRHYPPMVMEVANSESANTLATAGEDYILQSDNFIATVIGFKIPFHPRPTKNTQWRQTKPPDPAAHVTLWRSVLKGEVGDVGTIMDQVLFRSGQGKAEQGTLCLSVRDFMPPAVLNNKDSTSSSFLIREQLDETLAEISFARLSEMLDKAEDVQRENWRPVTQRFGQEGQTATRKRKRTSPQAQWTGTVAADEAPATANAEGGTIAERLITRRNSEKNA